MSSDETMAADEPAPARDVAVVPAKERHRARSITATVLGVLSVIVLVAAVVTVWATATILRPEPVAELVGDALAEPDVQAAFADKLAAEAVSAVDLETRLTAALPAQLQRFAPTLTAGAQAAVERAMAEALGTEEVQRVVVRLVERAHAKAMRLLEGDGIGHGVSIEDGTVTINALPLISVALGAIQSRGLLENVKLPDLKADGDPSQQIAELSAAVNRPLPATFGQLVVYRSASLAKAQANLQNAQDMLVLAKRATWLVVILWAVLVAAALIVATRRWKATLILGLGTIAGMVLLRSAARRVVVKAPDLAERSGGKAAIRAILGGATESLLRLAGVLLLVGLLAAAIAILRRRQWRSDLVLVVAVAAGSAVVGIVGLSIWTLIIGIVVGVAVPYLARLLLPVGPPSAGPTSPTATEPSAPEAPTPIATTSTAPAPA